VARINPQVVSSKTKTLFKAFGLMGSLCSFSLKPILVGFYVLIFLLLNWQVSKEESTA
jgi:hypothetical protein